MSVADILVVIALILAIVEEFQSRGRHLLGWAVVLVCIALLWGSIG